MLENIKENIELAPFTTFKIGGNAKFFAEVSTKNDLIEIIKWSEGEKLSIFVLGGGSNILISDKGFNGLVIKLKFNDFQKKDSSFFVGSSVPLAKLVSSSIENNLTGLEWGAGIPGTIGGAVVGNAGAYGKDISTVIKKIEILDLKDLKIKKLSKKECEFNYRESIFKKNNSYIIISVVIELEKGNKEESHRTIRGYLKNRSYKQSAKSAGCFFKNIPWEEINKEEFEKKYPELKDAFLKPKLAAGFLIDSLGLKGKNIGGALISNEHASYIVNNNNATAEHVIMLAGLIKERVEHKYGIRLEEEVRLIGFD